ncbi:MAG: FAD-dependent oxidoreductase [Candidatus Asgardarchaeia archaeon]
MREYDVIVIGGGVTGAGIARDAAMRGFKTLILERKDFSSGATGACMGMIAGPVGLPVEREFNEWNVQEAQVLKQIAAPLMHTVPFLTPVFSETEAVNQYKFLQLYYEIAKKYGEREPVFLSREHALKLEPRLNKEIYGATYHEEYAIDVFRLVIENLLSAKNYGADVYNYHEVTRILKKNGQVYGVVAKDLLTGNEKEFYGKIVVNATGPWAPKIAELADVEVKMRPTKGVILILERRITNVGLQMLGIDMTFKELVPHENTTLIGPTSDDYFGDPDELTITRTEIELILESLSRLLPSLREHRIIRGMAGLRPLLYKWGKPAAKVPRDFKVFDHEEQDDVGGFISVVGGNMTIYRLMAEKTVDLIAKLLDKDVKCRTHLEPLPVNEKPVNISELSQKYNIPEIIVRNMYTRQGSKIEKILSMIEENESYKSIICTCEPVITAEVIYSLEHEWVNTVDDLRRRTRIGVGPCQGSFCTHKVIALLAKRKGWGPLKAQQEMLAFLNERWKGKYPILSKTQIPQEELTQAIYVGLGLRSINSTERDEI